MATLSIIHATKFDEQTDKVLRFVSKALGMPISTIIREATKKHAEALKQQAIFMQEGQEALERMNKSGKHATEEEVGDWLDSWGADKELEKPKCHV